MDHNTMDHSFGWMGAYTWIGIGALIVVLVVIVVMRRSNK